MISLIVYVFTLVKTEKSDVRSEFIESNQSNILRNSLDLLLFSAGVAATIIGARLLITESIELARGLAISESLIGVSIVALGTSMPELITSVVAAFKKQGNIAYGNIIGSNIYNIFGILGAKALITPMPVPNLIARFDIWVMCGAAMIMLISAITHWTITRREGALYITLYIAYIFALLDMA